MDARGRQRAVSSLTPAALLAVLALVAAGHAARAVVPAPAAAATPRTVDGALRAAARAGHVTPRQARAWRTTHARARATLRRLGGAPRAQLGAVLADLAALARAGRLTPSRMPLAFLGVRRNAQFYGAGRSLRVGRRTSFRGSLVVWEHVAGHGLQFHPLGNAGRANSIARACLGRCPHRAVLRRFLDELMTLASRRDGLLAWEYRFPYAGGRPPWVSAMAQATAMQAFARGADIFGDPRYARTARAALRLLEARAPRGVRVPARGGAGFLHYSFAPGRRVLNSWLQTVVALREYARRSGDPRGRALFRAGDRALRRALPRFALGAWSRYELGGGPATGAYHRFHVQLLGRLCKTTGRAAYCAWQRRFRAGLR